MRGDETLKIAIAETSVIVRSGLALVLKRIQGLKLLPIEVVSPEALLDCIRIHKPDILMMNPAFPVFGDIRELKKEAGELHMKYIALLCALGDAAVLKNYDDTFSLYDDPT
ncbi:MAG: DNA-binding response regulator, partial [Odoribacter sp.]|nr:DNA-binding response regulator [Odoribacter sp.]